MMQFCKKVIVFLVPVCLVFVLPFFVIYFGKEYFTNKEIVTLQQANPGLLFGFAYNGSSKIAYKRELIDVYKPDVIVLGTSRVLEMRKEFFRNQETFVNAGCPCMAKTLEDVEYFVDTIQASSGVKVILLGLDFENFYKKDDSSVSTEDSTLHALKNTLFLTSKNIYLDYLSHKFSLSEVYARSHMSQNIGILAILHGDGFRADGSYQYNREKNNKERNINVASMIERQKLLIIKTDHSTTKKESEIVDANLKQLQRILDTASKKGIVVIGFTSPYPDEIYTSMRNSSGIYNDMVTTLPLEIKKAFLDHHMDFFEITLNDINAKDTEFIDSIHGTDKMSLRMLLYIGERSNSMREYIDVVLLRSILKNTKGDFLTF